MDNNGLDEFELLDLDFSDNSIDNSGIANNSEVSNDYIDNNLTSDDSDFFNENNPFFEEDVVNSNIDTGNSKTDIGNYNNNDDLNDNFDIFDDSLDFNNSVNKDSVSNKNQNVDSIENNVVNNDKNNISQRDNIDNLQNKDINQRDNIDNLQKKDANQSDNIDNLDKKKISQNDNIDNYNSVNNSSIDDSVKGNTESTSTSKNGQNKCPKCGATDISLNVKNGKLRCNFCRHEFEPEYEPEILMDLTKLHGQIILPGAQNIKPDASDIVTLKCSSCGAEVVIDTSEAMQARCHWCRNTLSLNEQVPNGSVPDVVLPFSIQKDEARQLIEGFVKKRRFYAHPKFKKEFSSENIMGVYFPYMVVDINGHASFKGKGEHLLRKYTVKHGDSETTYYDAELYEVEREFDIIIDNLTVESSSDKLSTEKSKTNNIINSILPFDVENAVKWNANYLKGYTSEKRDVNIEQLIPMVYAQSKDIARFSANKSLKYYDRGVNWNKDDLEVEGQQWCAAHFPVWLYSYYEKKGKKGILHYVAVNARTKETMGSIPLNMKKLIGVSALIEILSGFAAVELDFDGDIFLLAIGVIYLFIIYGSYRNKAARHIHEAETDNKTYNLRKVDEFVKKETKLKNRLIEGCNNNEVKGNKFGK